MKRNLLISLSAAIVMVLTAGAGRALAQNPNCCFYAVNSSNIPAGCFPLTLTTTWSGGAAQTVTLTSPRYATFPVPIPCPPAQTIVSATISTPTLCCINVVTYYCGGCLFIELIPC